MSQAIEYRLKQHRALTTPGWQTSADKLEAIGECALKLFGTYARLPDTKARSDHVFSAKVLVRKLRAEVIKADALASHEMLDKLAEGLAKLQSQTSPSSS